MRDLSTSPPPHADHDDPATPRESEAGLPGRLTIVDQLVTLYRPVGQVELDLIERSGWTAFPPRLAHQPIFYPVINEAYAVQIARDWNTKDEASGFVGYVTRFALDAAYASRFERRIVGGSEHEELWVPAADLAQLNRHIVGRIEVVHEFRGE